MFFWTPYITNESLLEAKSNFGVQVSIKNGPKSYEKLPLTTTKIIDFHLIFVHFSLRGASYMIVDMDAGWVGSKSENVEKALVFQCFFASARYLEGGFILFIRPSNLQNSVPRASIPASFLIMHQFVYRFMLQLCVKNGGLQAS